ncbi:MAG TPA: hypothetical protein VNF29_15665 [Candidatus Binataceae bacterium]|nr:hypothetical protein [Candidatus Binataceae bacterium]
MKRSKWFVPLAVAGAAAVLGVFALQRAPRAQSAAPQRYAGPDIAAGGTLSSSGPMQRTSEAITADAALAPSGPVPAAALRVRPTMPQAQYAALKAAANAHTSVSRSMSADAASPSAPAPILTPVNFPGAKEGVIGANEFPSDVDADVSRGQVVQITNSSLWVFNKSGTILAQRSLNALLGTTDFVGDVQVLFDSTWKRWVLTVDDFTNSSLWIAISNTYSATSGWIVYRTTGGVLASPDFLDYPHLGMDQDALLLTGNIFDSSDNYLTTVAVAVPKARVYNGLGFSVPIFSLGQIGTLMPPVQLGAPFYGNFPADYFAVAAAGSGVSLYTMTNASTTPSMSGPVSISNTNFSTPPAAVQPGCANTIDTLDGRFQNACYQIPPTGGLTDGLLYCVHTVDSSGFPTPLWYAFDPSTNTVNSSGLFYLSSTSDDFNPAIAADALGDIFVTETATDPTGGLKPMVLFGGALAGNSVALNTTPAAVSGVCLSGDSNPVGTSPQRWGDYSAARFDPATSINGTPGSVIGWITNQRVAGANAWGTKIAKIKQ